MFIQGRNRDSIKVTKDVYPEAAKKLKAAKCTTVARQIERLCHQCWDRIEGNVYHLERIVGNHAKELETPSGIIFLLACYIKYEKPFQIVLEQEPALTF